MPTGRAHHVVYDCPDPGALATFYAALLGLPISYRSTDWVVVSRDDRSSGFAFQLAADLQPPDWPDPHRPQQMHLDVMVDDLTVADRAVRELGARRLSDSQYVYADPAGHPFCLIPRPGWAAPVGPADSA